MKRPAPFRPRRAIRIARVKPQSRSSAAVELVRLEYERARLETEMTSFCSRAESAMRDLEEIDARARQLTEMLHVSDGAQPAIAQPATERPRNTPKRRK